MKLTVSHSFIRKRTEPKKAEVVVFCPFLSSPKGQKHVVVFEMIKKKKKLGGDNEFFSEHNFRYTGLLRFRYIHIPWIKGQKLGEFQIIYYTYYVSSSSIEQIIK
jgi:hypothetical protein